MAFRRGGVRRPRGHDRDRRRRQRAGARPAARQARGDRREFPDHLSAAPPYRLPGRSGMSDAPPASIPGGIQPDPWFTPVRIALIVWGLMSLIAIAAKWGRKSVGEGKDGSERVE